MITNVATEIIKLTEVTEYTPTQIQDRSTFYFNIGNLTTHNGKARGPIFRVVFIDLAAVTATHVKIYGIGADTIDANVPVIPKSYLVANPVVDILLRKIVFTDAAGTPVPQLPANYTIHGHKLSSVPIYI